MSRYREHRSRQNLRYRTLHLWDRPRAKFEGLRINGPRALLSLQYTWQSSSTSQTIGTRYLFSLAKSQSNCRLSLIPPIRARAIPLLRPLNSSHSGSRRLIISYRRVYLDAGSVWREIDHGVLSSPIFANVFCFVLICCSSRISLYFVPGRDWKQFLVFLRSSVYGGE